MKKLLAILLVFSALSLSAEEIKPMKEKELTTLQIKIIASYDTKIVETETNKWLAGAGKEKRIVNIKFSTAVQSSIAKYVLIVYEE
jgi:hypothetical protein